MSDLVLVNEVTGVMALPRLVVDDSGFLGGVGDLISTYRLSNGKECMWPINNLSDSENIAIMEKAGRNYD